MKTDIGQKARELFDKTDYNCAQSVLLSIIKAHGLDFKEAPAAAAGFGGGIGFEGMVCGAVSGSVMALGLLLSQRIPDEKKLKEKTYSVVQKFIARIESEFGSVTCRNLTGVNLKDSEQLEAARKQGIFETVCMNLVVRSAEIVTELVNAHE